MVTAVAAADTFWTRCTWARPFLVDVIAKHVHYIELERSSAADVRRIKRIVEKFR